MQGILKYKHHRRLVYSNYYKGAVSSILREKELLSNNLIRKK